AQEVGENSVLGGVTLEAFLVGRFEPWESSAHALTDAGGAFELDGLLDRPYALFALDPRTLAGAGPLELASGDEHGLLRLDAPVARAIAGRVRSPSGTPLAGVRVALGRSFPWRADEGPHAQEWQGFPLRSPVASWLFSGSAVTDAEGRFALAPVETRGVH